jgi:chromosome segregation ATPase
VFGSILQWIFGRTKLRQELALILETLSQLKRTIDMKFAELAAELRTLGTQQEKVQAEVRGLIDKIDELKLVIDGHADVPPDVQDALAALKAKADAVDALVADAPPAPAPSPADPGPSAG